jgi:PPK2 family polyphosphate:nucleotide phosphotransferase
MPFKHDLLPLLRVEPGEAADIASRDPGWKGREQFSSMSKDELKAYAAERLGVYIDELTSAQDLLYASDTYSLLVVFQAMDAAGKDGTIKHVMSGVNPQGCQVFSFKQPSAEELDHTYLWRCMKALPERGRIGIFNRSYYEDVLVVRVHPELLDHAQLPPDVPRNHKLWKQRYEDINAFERHLDRNGTKVVKFFLHVSKKEQRKRFLERLENPDKHWKFSDADLAERAHWDEYMDAYEDALTATSTPWAPWHVIPADHKFVMRTLVAGILAHTIDGLDLSYPEVGPEKMAAIATARERLRAE